VNRLNEQYRQGHALGGIAPRVASPDVRQQYVGLFFVEQTPKAANALIGRPAKPDEIWFE
jgi:hypothetical protein